eukprot:CAMPEP_0116147996 /NCGR_PEP_ID=MMETSP0329-20121206/18086_1 /TAXON_ID=697910 /ORGANISM="Pseudo-nitzschia arenysensis, Strain B593" /LENGTH=411 /DNA_ID=CAMNT_0003644029 /DNA_START=66 /DNA_END=1301 /DNA_ORIENTATION=-
MFSLFNPSAFSKSALCLLLLAGTAVADNPRILDLSEDLPVGELNEDAVFLETFMTRDVRRFIVLDDGEVVMNYQRDTVRDGEVYNMWSATKAFASFVVGTILTSDRYDLGMNDTLGEIFVGEKDWSLIEDPEELDFKQNVTIYQLMTMTSGLVNDIDITEVINPLAFSIDVPNSAGINLKQSLADPTYNVSLAGDFHYMPISNILSYVVKEVTGMPPLEYISVDILPSMGISPDEIKWDANLGGVQTSFSNLHMTGLQMAKFAQLYLQMGKASPDKELISAEFVTESLTPHFYADAFLAPFGYLWVYRPFNTTADPSLPDDGMWCAAGLMAQYACVNFKTNRVTVLQRSNTLWDVENWFTYGEYLIPATFSSNYTWNVTANITEASTSGALSLSVWGAMAMVALSCLASLF